MSTLLTMFVSTQPHAAQRHVPEITGWSAICCVACWSIKSVLIVVDPSFATWSVPVCVRNIACDSPPYFCPSVTTGSGLPANGVIVRVPTARDPAGGPVPVAKKYAPGASLPTCTTSNSAVPISSPEASTTVPERTVALRAPSVSVLQAVKLPDRGPVRATWIRVLLRVGVAEVTDCGEPHAENPTPASTVTARTKIDDFTARLDTYALWRRSTFRGQTRRQQVWFESGPTMTSGPTLIRSLRMGLDDSESTSTKQARLWDALFGGRCGS
jgi:hypothetical protein